MERLKHAVNAALAMLLRPSSADEMLRRRQREAKRAARHAQYLPNCARETARRRRQIETGRLREQNGLVRDGAE